VRLPKNVAVLTLAICLPLLSVARAQEKKLEPVSISYASVTGTRAPLWIGKDMGIFEKHGLDAKLILISGGLPAVSALIAGDVQFIGTGGSVVAAAAARGAPLVIVATFGSIAYKLIGLPQLSSIQDLKGKAIGGLRPGTTTDFVLRRLLLKVGLVPDRDVTIIPTGLTRSDQRLLLMLQGRFQATLGTDDNVSQLEMQGYKMKVLAEPLKLGVATPASDISTTRQFLATRRSTAKSFLQAFCEAIALARKDREVAYRVYRKYLKVEDPKLLETTYQNYIYGQIPAKPYPLEDAIQADIEDLSATIPELKGKKASDFMDDSILRELESEGFFARLYR
jgi:NitT/TauT family transport system substrate-binding protein